MAAEKEPPPGSLRALGGSGREVVVPGVSSLASVEKILNSPPSLAAAIVLNESHALRGSMEGLLRGNVLLPRQYELIGDELLDYVARSGNDALRERDSAMLRDIIARCGSLTAARIRRALTPDDDSRPDGLDIIA